MTDFISSGHKASPGKKVNSPVFLRGLRRRWKIGVIAFLLGFCGGIFFADPALGLAFGLVLGICLPLFFEYLDQTIKSADDVRHKLGLTVLATLPRFPLGAATDGETPQRLVTALSPGAPALSAYGSLCSNLKSAGVGEEGKLIMVTSCIPGEGKSTVSANLAISLAESGAKVLLVGCDLRRPALSELFEETHYPGLSELLTGEDNPGPRKLSHFAIDFMPAGKVPPYPADLLESKKMREYLASVKEQYDYVVLDAPPVLPVTDSKLLAPLCDLRLMVLEPCRIPLRMAMLLIKTLREIGTRIDGVVLNDRSGRASLYYGAFGEYGRDEGADTSRATSVVPSGTASPVGKWLVSGAVLLAVAITGLSWQVLRNGEKSPELKGFVAANAPDIPGKSRVVPAASLPERLEDSLPDVARSEPVPPQVMPASVEQSPVLLLPTDQETLASRSTAVEIKLEESPVAAPVVLRDPVILRESIPSTDVSVIAEKKPEKPIAKPAIKSVTKPATKPVAKTASKPAAKGLQSALVALARVWQKNLPDSAVGDNLDIKSRLRKMGFLASTLGTNLSSPLQCGTPLLLVTRQEETGTTWITVVGRKGYKWRVSPQTRQGDLLSETELKRIWTGKGYLPWQDPLQLAALDAGVNDPERTAGLQQLLVKAGYLDQFESGSYGRETIKAIGHLQAASGLEVNGRLTPETLVLLYQGDPAFKTPKFSLW